MDFDKPEFYLSSSFKRPKLYEPKIFLSCANFLLLVHFLNFN
uniref:Uncharacterized protein n=1 Tax=Anguilla anguilla TaxID=7936 RepID=A0A0E9T841_ANGAN